MDAGLERLAEEVLQEARSRKLMIATAESCTGGLVAGALTSIAGSSDVFERGFVTYSNEAKVEMLGIDPALIQAQWRRLQRRGPGHGCLRLASIEGAFGSVYYRDCRTWRRQR